MVKAKCIKNIDPWGDKPTDLIVGEMYEVESVSMGQSYTDVYLVGKNSGYNSVMFEFYEDGKSLDIYSDARFNPYIRRYYK